ncbi:MAG: hypothetical protein E7643_02860 [Ruminococcaceae bacterium]|nr:hypothetical protein [Oscillospiraceae bacterium]
MEKRTKNGQMRKRVTDALRDVGMIYKDTAVLHGERGATVYGCRRILCYSPERICLCIGKRHVFVQGKGLICTSFNAGCVTVEGQLEGIGYCRSVCTGACTEKMKGEGEA